MSTIRLMAASMFLASGCTVAVTQAQMQDSAQLAQLAHKVDTAQNNGAHVKKIAFIGLETPNHTQEAQHSYNPGGVAGAVISTADAIDNANERSKEIACRALDAGFDSFVKSLTDAGFELAPFEDKLQMDKYKLFVNAPLPEWCYAKRAPARMNFINPFEWKDTFRVVQQLIDDLGVDAIVMAQLEVDRKKSGPSKLSVYVKSKDGYAVVGWEGHVDNGQFEFEAAQPGETDEAKLATATRVFTNTFQLLATKMAMEAK